MTEKKGVARLRRAIKNQRDLGNGDFRLTYHDAEEIADEIEKEFESLSWAVGVPAPVDADGEVVPLTPEELYTSGSMMIRVTYICFIGGLWCALSRDSESLLLLNVLHLKRPDSWERLEKDISKAGDEDICGYFGIVLNEPCSAECPARGAHDSCAVTAVRDVARRAKALAERDVKEATQRASSYEAKEANRG